MRLLNVHTLELEEFPHRRPCYAAASHRWIEGAESSFQDVCAKRNLGCLGYQKIEKFAAFVRDRLHHIDYLWIDTCCIDKTNSQELQEAITAMYKWYACAAICLVYLSDVENSDRAAPSKNLEDIRQSVWFTRGWTLQELIAPQLVVFLSKTWEVIGHKAQDNNKDFASPLPQPGPKLNRQIAAITGIPEIVLAQPERRRSLSVQERLAWASNRTSTRPEDVTYSLLGLFEVSMPLIYEEGETAARRRLLKAIAEANEEIDFHLDMGVGKLSISEPRQDRSINRLLPSSTVPFLRDPAFIDRTELHQLEGKLSTPGVRVALVGLGGVGKSQLAIEYCYRLRERRPSTWVLWVHVGSASRYEQSLRKLAGDVAIPGNQEVKTDIFEMVYHWLRDVRNGQWLLVLDNADDAEFLFEPPDTSSAPLGHRAVRGSGPTRLDFLPICAHGSIIFTSRYRAVAAKLVDDYHLIPVLPMTQDAAVALLSSRIGQEQNAEASKRLAVALDCMPLAITQAAAYLKQRRSRCSIEQYLEKLEKSNKSKSKLLSTTALELRRDQEAENSLVLTWQISFNHLRSVRKSAADRLSLMSFFDHQSIPDYLLRIYSTTERTTPGTTPDDDNNDGASKSNSSRSSASDSDADNDAFEDDLAILQDYDFISVAPSGREFKVHRLIQFATQIWLKSVGQYQQRMAQAIDTLNGQLPHGGYEKWRRCDILYPHAKMMLDLMPETRDACLQRSHILHKAASSARYKGLTREGEKLVYASLQAREGLVSDEDEGTLNSLELLTLVMEDQGRYGEAEQVCRRILALLSNAPEYECISTETTMNRLAMVLQFQGKYDEAEPIIRQALQRQETMLGPDHRDTLDSVEVLSFVLKGQRRYAEAKLEQQRIVKREELVLGSEHPKTLTRASNLAVTLQAMGELEEAERIGRQVLNGREKWLGLEHRDTLSTLNNLSIVLQLQGKFEEAEILNRQALEIRERILGPEHHQTILSVWSLGYLKGEQKQYNEAISLYERASAGLTGVLGSQHPHTIACVEDLSALREGAHQVSCSSQQDQVIREEENLQP